MKRTGVARTPLRRGEKLRDKVEAQLARIKRMPQLVRSFFQAPDVAYITSSRVIRFQWGIRMRAELKRIHSQDVHNLVSYRPEGPFGVLIQMMVGPEGAPGEEAFDTIVCSPDWVAAYTALPGLVGDHGIVMSNYDYVELFGHIQEFCRFQEGNTWREIALKVSKIGEWEFANYK